VIARARWILPIEQPPIAGGWVTIEDGVIHAIGHGHPPAGPVADFGDAAILPGLVNAHTHLELSWLSGRIPPATAMPDWIRGVMAARRDSPHEDMQRVSAVMALAVARRQGTVAFGDITNTLVTAAPLADEGVPSVLFYELLGFLPDGAAERAARAAEAVSKAAAPPVRAGLAPHAPFSTSPQLFAALAREARARRLPVSVHLGESPEEVELLQTGRGPFRDLLMDLGVWDEGWTAPGSGPVEYLDRLGVLAPGLLAVHATHLAPGALATLAARGCVIVSCPRSNRWTCAGDPPLDAFYASGATVAFGTDSLASADSLDMFAELAAARRVSTVPDAALLASATRGGAIALGLDAEYGRLAPGLRGPLLAVSVPAGTSDVEEYLVSGKPRDMQWVG
jgi:cytosine/adenosine deaminase-related metal-dependent hydrolase